MIDELRALVKEMDQYIDSHMKEAAQLTDKSINSVAKAKATIVWADQLQAIIDRHVANEQAVNDDAIHTDTDWCECSVCKAEAQDYG